MSFLQKVADNSTKTSFSHKMRYGRFIFFMNLINKLNRPLHILDIGGTQEYWTLMGLDASDIKITLLNLTKQEVSSVNFEGVVGNATDLKEYPDNEFDIVFSNSVIEHLYTAENQQKMANEVKRVGKYYFIQTPNYFFPLEPHFLFPGFQFLPFDVRVVLINKFNLGHVPRRKNIEEARRQIREIRLLSKRDMKKLFPGASIWEEKIYGLTKSIVSHNFY